MPTAERRSLPRDGDVSWNAPLDVREHRLNRDRDLPEIPGPGGERWSQAPKGDTQPYAALTPGKVRQPMRR
jgi:hypothetical protein